METTNQEIKPKETLKEWIENSDKEDAFMSKILELDPETILVGIKTLFRIFPTLRES